MCISERVFTSYKSFGGQELSSSAYVDWNCRKRFVIRTAGEQEFVGSESTEYVLITLCAHANNSKGI